MEKAKRIYDYVTLNVRYHYQPSYFIHESLPEHCARDRRGDCGIMSVTFITLLPRGRHPGPLAERPLCHPR